MKKPAFSVVEMLVALVVVMLVLSLFLPVFTSKRLGVRKINSTLAEPSEEIKDNVWTWVNPGDKTQGIYYPNPDEVTTDYPHPLLLIGADSPETDLASLLKSLATIIRRF